MSVASAPRNWLPLMLPLMLLGLVIGVICIPLNEIDSISDHVLTDVFALGEGLGWFVLLPLIAMPLVLQLQHVHCGIADCDLELLIGPSVHPAIHLHRCAPLV